MGPLNKLQRAQRKNATIAQESSTQAVRTMEEATAAGRNYAREALEQHSIRHEAMKEVLTKAPVVAGEVPSCRCSKCSAAEALLMRRILPKDWGPDGCLRLIIPIRAELSMHGVSIEGKADDLKARL